MNDKLRKMRYKLINKYSENEPWKDACGYSEACENAYEAGFNQAVAILTKEADEILVKGMGKAASMLNPDADPGMQLKLTIEQWRREVGE